MKRILFGLLGIMVLTGSFNLNFAFAESAQQLVDAQASRDADLFLKGLKVVDLPEGKQMIANTAWKIRDLPVLIESTTIYEGMFETDITGIKGYKRLLQVSVQSKAGTELKKKYLLVSYKDPKENNWKVLGFGESADVEYEYNAARKHKDEPFAGKKEMLPMGYRRYGYWASLAGKLQESLDSYIKAGELIKEYQKDIIKNLPHMQELSIERNGLDHECPKVV